jgi:hypothetical protein
LFSPSIPVTAPSFLFPFIPVTIPNLTSAAVDVIPPLNVISSSYYWPKLFNRNVKKGQGGKPNITATFSMSIFSWKISRIAGMEAMQQFPH